MRVRRVGCSDRWLTGRPGVCSTNARAMLPENDQDVRERAKRGLPHPVGAVDLGRARDAARNQRCAVMAEQPEPTEERVPSGDARLEIVGLLPIARLHRIDAQHRAAYKPTPSGIEFLRSTSVHATGPATRKYGNMVP